MYDSEGVWKWLLSDISGASSCTVSRVQFGGMCKTALQA
jgi:hypothetical protein